MKQRILNQRTRMPRPRKVIDTSTYSGRFAVRLRELRDKAGLSTKELSEMTGIPKSTLEAWEADSRSPVNDQLLTLAKTFKIPIAKLLPKD